MSLVASDYGGLSLSSPALLSRSAVTGGYLSRPDTSDLAGPELTTREWTCAGESPPSLLLIRFASDDGSCPGEKINGQAVVMVLNGKVRPGYPARISFGPRANDLVASAW